MQSKTLYASGYFEIYKNYGNLYLDTLKISKYILTNTSIISYYTNKDVFINIKTHFNKKLLFFAGKIDDNYIHYSTQIDNIALNYKNFYIKLDNLLLTGKTTTLFNKYDMNFKANDFFIKNQKLKLKIFKLKGDIQNNIITISALNAIIKYPLYFKNLKLDNFYLNYDLKTNSLISFSNNLTLNYKKYILNSNKISLNYNLNTQNFFLHGTHLNINDDVNLSSNEIVISKMPTLYFYLKNNSVEHKYFHLNNQTIKGDKRVVILSDIIGKALGFDINISTPQINLQKKYITSNQVIFNKIAFFKTKFIFNKKPYILTSSTNTLFNQNIKEILHKFKIDIPFTQTKGNNNLTFKIILITNNLKNLFYDFNSSNAFFKINDINFSYSNLNLKGDLNYSKVYIKNFSFPYQYFNTNFDSNISLNLKDKYINSFSYIYKLDIDKYLNIKNFKEKIVMNLKKNFIYLLNSSIFINLNNKTIYLYSLKNLLKYSIFNKLLKDGKVLIKLLNKKIIIQADAISNYPLILNQKNPYKIHINSIITNNNILIQNKYINTQIINFNEIYSHLNNIDININSLIKIINSVKEIVNKIKSKENNQTDTLKVFISSNHTNFIYKNHKFLTNKADLVFNDEINFSATYKQSFLKGYTKNNYLLIEGKNYNKESLTPLLEFFNHFSYINLDFILVRSPESFYTGKIFIKKGAIKDLGTLNNIIAFINTIPALLTLHTPGFSSKGYKIKDGYINYLFYKNILYFKKITIKGINLDFSGKGYVDLNKNYIKMKLHTIIKIKLKKIPIIGKAISYLLFGKDGYLHLNIFVQGNLDNPKISKDLGGGIIESPLKLFKRIITLPFNIF